MKGATADAELDVLWAITCYFNPVGYRQRLSNYRTFRARLNAPLVAVELGFDDTFELSDGDADVLIQLRGGDVMWQKERLLNLAFAAVPEACRKIAWLDCDIVFDRTDWAEAAGRLLDRLAFVQLFDQVYYMPADLDRAGLSRDEAILHRTGLAAAINGGDPEARLGEILVGNIPRHARGLAWAARREILDGRGLFDACIIGGGDSAMACASYGCLDYILARQKMHAPQAERYLDWAEPFHRQVAGDVGALAGDIFHLWHGDIERRGHRRRYQGFSAFGFDPGDDIAMSENGVWCWNSDKPEMHDYVRRYFASREEDG